MKWLRLALAYVAALLLLAWRQTCRYEFVNDPRPDLRRSKKPYLYALLHAHQLGAVLANDDAQMTAMVSRSADGDWLVPSLRVRRVIPVRGSTRKSGRDKGGREALEQMRQFLAQGVPGLLAVDGPRGPRGTVHRGIADLAKACDAAVLPVVVISTRRWILHRAWDRFQIPRPGARVSVCFGPVLLASAFADAETLRSALGKALADLEAHYDPDEAAPQSKQGLQ
jgi:lysophospholipid acyltransferase (LPLAT)-like uncharacterized protein